MRQQDLTRLALEVRAWGSEPARFRWFEAPPVASLDHATGVLQQLGATDEHGLTPLGHALAKLPVDPRLGRVLLAGRAAGCARLAANLAALASERAFLRAPADLPGESDLDLPLAALDALDRGRSASDVARQFGADGRTLRQVVAMRDQLLRAVIDQRAAVVHGDVAAAASGAPQIATLLLTGFPDRVARRREPRGERLVLVGGRGALLDGRSCVRDAAFLLCVTMGANDRGRDPTVYSAVAIDPATLPTTETLVTNFDLSAEAVIQHIERRYLDLVMETRPAGALRDAAALAACLADATRSQPQRALRLDEDTMAWLTRLRWLAEALPDAGLPTLPELSGDGDVATSDVPDAIDVLCAGRRSWAALRRLDVVAELTAWLPWATQQLLAREAPSHWTLPCGVEAPVRYTLGHPPVISAKAQHFFGMHDTPRLAQGRVAVACELLAPNGRPTQVTADLAGFWRTSWLEVRKDLRGRYPKHPWPEAPTLQDARKGRRRRQP